MCWLVQTCRLRGPILETSRCINRGMPREHACQEHEDIHFPVVPTSGAEGEISCIKFLLKTLSTKSLKYLKRVKIGIDPC